MRQIITKENSMTSEDAIKYLKQLYPYGGHCWLDEQRTEAIGMAIEALKEEPTIATVGKPKEAEGALKELLDNIDEKELTKVREEMMQEEPSIPEIVDEHSWEMLGEEPVSEDLEEAIDTYLATYFGSEKEKQEWPFLKKMAIYFAEWQREQMLKDAVEGKVLINGMGNPILHLWDKGKHLIDKKVKVILIKEE